MGIYLNPGNVVFRETVEMETYVDKSMLLKVTNGMLGTAQKYICMSRPRRFGKTITQNMIAAYYSKGCDSRELFENLKISKESDFEKYLNKYNVIQIDLNSEYQNVWDKDRLMIEIQDKVKSEVKDTYPDVSIEDRDSLAEAVLKVYSKTGDTFIILIDEYDVLVREQVSQKLFDEYLSFLNGLFKSNTIRPAISMAYLTGILPVVRDKIQSKLNNFDEYTILGAGRFSEFMGFTGEEVRSMCEEYNLDYEDCRNWYDGYVVNGYELYSPESVIKAMREGCCEGYWSRTSSYRVITDRLEQNFSGAKDDIIRMLAGEEIDVNVTGYLNTMNEFAIKDDMFTYLIHLGYLAYNKDEKTCRIPNREVRQEWFNALAVSHDYEVTDSIIKSSKELLDRTLKGDGDAVANALDISHIHVASNRSYNNEDVFQSAIYLAFIYALNKYDVRKEMTTGKGFADVVYIPLDKKLPAMVIELKHNKSSESALDQIKEKQYFDSMEKYTGEVLLVGINYDEKSKKHSCRIEKYIKQ